MPTHQYSKNTLKITQNMDDRFGEHWRVEAVQALSHPIEVVFPFFADAYNLERLTPQFLNFRVKTPKPITLSSGTMIDYTLKIHRLPIKWKTEILDWNPPHSFVDNQARGPYTLWHHTHLFESTEDGATICRDIVHYRPKGWILASLINRFFVQRDVENIFRYRFEKLAEIFPTPAEQPAASETQT
jgi:ligand-binding SRPBCC domain-containing protein